MEEKQRVFQISADISLRRENFGGLMFMPVTGEILQLNQAGYDLIERVRDMDAFQIIPEDSTFWQELEKRGVVKEVIPHGKY